MWLALLGAVPCRDAPCRRPAQCLCASGVDKGEGSTGALRGPGGVPFRGTVSSPASVVPIATRVRCRSPRSNFHPVDAHQQLAQSKSKDPSTLDHTPVPSRRPDAGTIGRTATALLQPRASSPRLFDQYKTDLPGPPLGAPRFGRLSAWWQVHVCSLLGGLKEQNAARGQLAHCLKTTHARVWMMMMDREAGTGQKDTRSVGSMAHDKNRRSLGSTAHGLLLPAVPTGRHKVL
ncbi:hypothetical protein J3F83DRAFT_254951 [Trichoderma novae-zelandiae]